MSKLLRLGCLIRLLILVAIVGGIAFVAIQILNRGSGDLRELPSIEEYPYGIIIETGPQEGVYIVTEYPQGVQGILISNYYVWKNDKEGYYHEDMLLLEAEEMKLVWRQQVNTMRGGDADIRK